MEHCPLRILALESPKRRNNHQKWIKSQQKLYVKEAQGMQKLERPSQKQRSYAKRTTKRILKQLKQNLSFLSQKNFQNKEEKQKLFTGTVASIREKLSTEDRKNITILKTFIEKKFGKNLHAVCLIAPSKMQSSILQLKLKGIDVRGKHGKACGPRECSLNSFIREVTVHFRSLPHFFEDKDIYECINFPNV